MNQGARQNMDVSFQQGKISMMQDSQQKLLLNSGAVPNQPTSTDIVTTRIASDVAPGAFSNASLVGENGRTIPGDLFSSSPALLNSAQLEVTLPTDDSPVSAMRFAEAFRAGEGLEEANGRIETIFPVLREVADQNETLDELRTVGSLAAGAGEPRDDSDMETRITRLRAALFGSA